MTPSSRQVAVEVLLAGESGERTDWVLDDLLARLGQPTWAPRATALAYGTLRLIARLDHLLRPYLNRPLEELDPLLRAVLRVGAYELLFAPHADPPAAVHALVDLAKDPGLDGHIGLGNLANAVLRRISVEADDLRRVPERWPTRRMMAVWWSLPEWLTERWLARFGEEQALELAAAAATDPTLTLRVNRTKIDRESFLAALAEVGVRARPSERNLWGVRLTAAAPSRLPGFGRGWFTAQDEASLDIAELCGVRPGDRVLDLCAAPGSKATQLAEMGARVVACDISPARLRRLDENVRRLGLDIRIIEADARDLPGRFEPADVVLLDAPCTGTGTLARRADLRWRLGPERLADAVALQRELLAAAVHLIAPGGRLVYSTCSLEREENEDQMTWLARGWPELLPDGEEGRTILPVAGQHDGFFFARRRRRD